jgi:(R,R)-butanediol dehydrogenase/meso-butanediol dehydrogenase/diacetyl reductase
MEKETGMKAAVLYGKQDLRVSTVPEPTPGEGQVKIRVGYSGICGSDLHIFYETDSPNIGVDYSCPHPLTGTTLPQILGHEIVGTVTEIGSGVEGFAVGDNAAVWPIYYCGECGACEIGAFGACLKIAFHGVSSDGGGMAEYTVVHASMLHRLPKEVGLLLGALVEPMAVGWHAVAQSGIEPGQSALILGAGPIGIGIYYALKARGVDNIVVSEPGVNRRTAITRLGAPVAVDPITGDLDSTVLGRTEGRGVHYAFDAAGVGSALPQAIRLVRPHGALVIVALHEKAFDFNPVSLLWQETRLLSARCYTHQDYEDVIHAMSEGLYSSDGWVDVVSLDKAAQAVQDLRSAKAVKVLIRVD